MEVSAALWALWLRTDFTLHTVTSIFINLHTSLLWRCWLGDWKGSNATTLPVVYRPNLE